MTEVLLYASLAIARSALAEPIALSSVTAQNHLRAVKLANQIEMKRTRLLSTQSRH
ncbi:hypothetical protein [Pleurocapsa sp. PCC 7319]|uniref:hypothetical protein n=1 Tax=Pleurocapsa sp. PCC 7319 TaxID=118161 RepID=UPI00034B460D|nr:hypothetical protein [Pleurocapsa sp. PCC 7319]